MWNFDDWYFDNRILVPLVYCFFKGKYRDWALFRDYLFVLKYLLWSWLAGLFYRDKMAFLFSLLLVEGRPVWVVFCLLRLIVCSFILVRYSRPIRISGALLAASFGAVFSRHSLVSLLLSSRLYAFQEAGGYCVTDSGAKVRPGLLRQSPLHSLVSLLLSSRLNAFRKAGGYCVRDSDAKVRPGLLRQSPLHSAP